jgi:hypothetical protein
MRKLLLISILLALVSSCCICRGAEYSPGVLSQERVINLPQDQSKWYISVVGDPNDPAYQKILDWFDSNDSLISLKNQVHFCPVSSKTDMYKERYAANTASLPMVRLQDSSGTVVYEVAGKNIPMSPEALNGAMAERARYVLPYRRNIDRRLDNMSKPVGPVAPDVDPAPQPIDDVGPPDFDSTPVGVPTLVVVISLVLSVIVGSVTGVVVEYNKPKKIK